MSILSAQSIRKLGIIQPLVERSVFNGKTYGLSSCGYDIRIDQTILMHPLGFRLASSIEHFTMPNNVAARVHDKSSWARKWITVQNTFIEPNWRGFLTLEITNHSLYNFRILRKGDPIAQIVFEWLDEPTEQPYVGKYQDAPRGPQPAIDEKAL